MTTILLILLAIQTYALFDDEPQVEPPTVISAEVIEK